MVTPPASAGESVAVTVTGDPSVTGFGEAESATVGGVGSGGSTSSSLSWIVIVTEDGLPAVTEDGS
ncbi:MAG: hypothetical protein OXG35_28630, partial [Acidobacteria bacterium]|nr:hypothetical protein [Acidobacteriota bacterium]